MRHQNLTHMVPAPTEERRRRPDLRLGRRRTDAWFPYNPGFVAQAIAQSTADVWTSRVRLDGIRAYGGGVPRPSAYDSFGGKGIRKIPDSRVPILTIIPI
jgi:hypothetical protein